jgi:hypothetical protein
LRRFFHDTTSPFHLECMIARRTPQESRANTPSTIGTNIDISPAGRLVVLRKGRVRFLPTDIPLRKLQMGSGNSKYKILLIRILFPQNMNSMENYYRRRDIVMQKWRVSKGRVKLRIFRGRIPYSVIS